MSLLNQLTPTNYLEEKERFFVDERYNPQFVYEESIDESELSKYGVPNEKYLSLAEEILKKAYFGRNEADLFMMEGPLLSQDDVTERAEHFLKLHKLHDRFQIVWSSSFVSRATINADTLKLRLPADFRKEGLLGMLYHEVGTHALRRINYERQPWYKKKKHFGLTTDYLRTEEGLATLHALIPHSFKLAYIPAIRFLAVHHAQKMSFAELWNFLRKYVQDPERRWVIAFREKRGLSDTSQPGGFTKDLVYFEGLVEIGQWLNTHHESVPDLFVGKVALQDLDRALSLSNRDELMIPYFYTADPAAYQHDVTEIINQNNLLLR